MSDLGMFSVSFGGNLNNAPLITEGTLRKADWVYFDRDNLFPQRLVRLADNCPIHSAAINKHAMFIAGDGLEFEDEERREEIEQVLTEKVGSIYEFVRRCAIDESMFDGHVAMFQYTNGRELLKVKHKDFSSIRAGKVLDKTTDLPERYWYSIDWTEATRRRGFAGKYINFEPKDFLNIDATPTRKGIMVKYAKKYKPTRIYYPEPSYISVLKYVETEINLGQYMRNLTIKGFRAGTHIHLFKELDGDEAIAAEKKVNDKFTGDVAPDIIVTFGGDPAAAPQINTMPNFTNAELVTVVSKELDKKIDSGHAIPSMLYTSFQTATGLDGQARAIREVLEYYQNSAVDPHQKSIENTLNLILSESGVDSKVKIRAVNPINFIVDKDVMLSTWTTDEVREEIGKQPFEDERGEVFPIQTIRNHVQQQASSDND